jgi:phosphohistidine phosphatase
MTRRLILLRHAKSAWPDLPDHERPLAKRGQGDAPIIGRWLREADLAPDCVLCSTARRTRETWQLMLPELGTSAPQVRYEERVYAANSETLLDLATQTEPETTSMLIIGHNPAIQDLTLLLAGGDETGSDAVLVQQATAKFPTAAAAVLAFAGAWSQLGSGQAQLTAFVTPSELRG